MQLFKDAIGAAHEYRNNPTDITDQIMNELETIKWRASNKLELEIEESDFNFDTIKMIPHSFK